MRTFLLAAALAAVLAGLAARGSAGAPPNHRISQVSIGGIPLGLPARAYERKLGRPTVTTRFGHGLTRLLYAGRELAVYVSRSGRGVAVMTSAREYRTPAGVGPCATASALKSAYRGRLRAARRGGQIVAYRVGRLVFATPGAKVGAVVLAAPAFPLSVVVNAGQCGRGEED